MTTEMEVICSAFKIISGVCDIAVVLSSSWWPIFLAGAHMIYVAYRYPSGVVSKLFIFLFVHAFHTVADRVLHDLAVTMLAFLVLITL